MKTQDIEKYALPGLTEIDILEVVRLSVCGKPLHEILDAFRTSFNPGLALTGKVVREIQDDFGARIAREATIYRNSIDTHPYSSDRTFLDMVQEVWESSREPKSTGKIALDAVTNEAGPEMVPDDSVSCKVLTILKDFLNDKQKLKNERDKNLKNMLPSQLPQAKPLDKPEDVASLQGPSWIIT